MTIIRVTIIHFNIHALEKYDILYILYNPDVKLSNIEIQYIN